MSGVESSTSSLKWQPFMLHMMPRLKEGAENEKIRGENLKKNKKKLLTVTLVKSRFRNESA